MRTGPQRQRGITVIEAALCVAASIAIAYVSVVALRDTRDRVGAAELVEDLDTLVFKVRERYRSEWNYSNVSAYALDRDGLLPARLSATVQAPTVSWLVSRHGRVDLNPVAVGGEASAGFQLSFPAVTPLDVCNDLVAYGVREAMSIARGTLVRYRNTDTVVGSAAHPTVRALVCAASNDPIRMVFQ